MRPPVGDEIAQLPHTVLTSDDKWDPSVLDNEVSVDDDDWHDTIDGSDDYQRYPFDAYGRYKHRHVNNATLQFF